MLTSKSIESGIWAPVLKIMLELERNGINPYARPQIDFEEIAPANAMWDRPVDIRTFISSESKRQLVEELGALILNLFSQNEKKPSLALALAIEYAEEKFQKLFYELFPKGEYNGKQFEALHGCIWEITK